MRLIYLDESGASSQQDRHIVVAGPVLEPDYHYDRIHEDLQILARRYVPPEKQHLFTGFHAVELFNGNPPIFDGWRIHETMPIIEGIVRIFVRYQIPIIYGVCDKSRYDHAGTTKALGTKKQAAHTMAFFQAVLRANRWMRKHAREDEVAILAVEDNKDNKEMHERMRHMQTWMRYPAEVPREMREDLPATKIIESILFAGKQDSFLMPLADMAAFLIRRKLSGREMFGLFDWLSPLIRPVIGIENDPVAEAIRKVPRYHLRMPRSGPTRLVYEL